MAVIFSDLGFTAPPINAEHGVDGLDVSSLRLAMVAASQTWKVDLRLPLIGAFEAPAVFDSLTQLNYGPGRTVRAHISLDHLTWAMGEGQIRPATMSDYEGIHRQAIAFSNLAVATPSSISPEPVALIRVPMALLDGRAVLLWAAELWPSFVARLDLYHLFDLAAKMTTGFDPKAAQVQVEVIMPVQRFDFQRDMTEINTMNQATGVELHQRITAHLDAGGLWVNTPAHLAGQDAAQTSRTGHKADPTVIGGLGPILLWLTASGSTMPVAVAITTAQAWPLR